MVFVLSNILVSRDIVKVTDITFEILFSKSFIDLQIVVILLAEVAELHVKPGDFETFELGVLHVDELIEIVVPQVFFERCSFNR